MRTYRYSTAQHLTYITSKVLKDIFKITAGIFFGSSLNRYRPQRVLCHTIPFRYTSNKVLENKFKVTEGIFSWSSMIENNHKSFCQAITCKYNILSFLIHYAIFYFYSGSPLDDWKSRDWHPQYQLLHKITHQLAWTFFSVTGEWWRQSK